MWPAEQIQSYPNIESTSCAKPPTESHVVSSARLSFVALPTAAVANSATPALALQSPAEIHQLLLGERGFCWFPKRVAPWRTASMLSWTFKVVIHGLLKFISSNSFSRWLFLSTCSLGSLNPLSSHWTHKTVGLRLGAPGFYCMTFDVSNPFAIFGIHFCPQTCCVHPYEKKVKENFERWLFEQGATILVDLRDLGCQYANIQVEWIKKRLKDTKSTIWDDSASSCKDTLVQACFRYSSPSVKLS